MVFSHNYSSHSLARGVFTQHMPVMCSHNTCQSCVHKTHASHVFTQHMPVLCSHNTCQSNACFWLAHLVVTSTIHVGKTQLEQGWMAKCMCKVCLMHIKKADLETLMKKGGALPAQRTPPGRSPPGQLPQLSPQPHSHPHPCLMHSHASEQRIHLPLMCMCHNRHIGQYVTVSDRTLCDSI